MSTSKTVVRSPVGDSPAKAGEWSDGWRPLVAGFVGMGMGWNFTLVVASLFLKPMQAEFGWSRTGLSFAPMATLIMAALLPVTGLLLDRFGARRIAIVGSLAMTLAYLIFATIPANRLYFFCATVYLAVAAAMSNSVVMARGVAPWFRNRLGTAIGLMMTGASVAAAIGVPLLSWTIEAHGWRSGFYGLAGATMLIALPMLLLWFREPPAKKGAAGTRPAHYRPMRDIARTLVFWQVAAASAVAALPIGGFIGHLIPILTDRGTPVAVAAGLGSTFAIAAGISRIANGALLDLIHPPLVAATTMILAVSGVCILLFTGGNSGWFAITAAIVLIGFAQGAEGDYIKYFSMRLFGIGNFSRVVAIMAMILSIGMALGGLIFAQVFDRFGSYLPAIIASSLLYMIAGSIFITLRMWMPFGDDRPGKDKAVTGFCARGPAA